MPEPVAPASGESHLWLTGASRSACADAVAVLAPDVAVDCHRGLRGPYTGPGSLLRAIVPQVHAVRPTLTAWHAIEILAAAPELDSLLGPVPETLTSLAPPGERTRWYSRYRTRRIAHGIVDFLRECAADRPLVLALRTADQADPTDAEFLAIALRRLDPAQVRLIVCTRGAEVTAELRDALKVYCRRQAVPEIGRPAAAGKRAAAAFVASDGTSDVPGEREAYLRLGRSQRARLHDQRAAELIGRGEASLRLGAIPYHLARGSTPDTEGKAALNVAIGYCIGMAFYDAALEMTNKSAALVDSGGDQVERYQLDLRLASCLSLLGRGAEVEPMYYDLLSRSTNPQTHANLWYALAMVYTRLLDTEHKDHLRARAYMNTALVIAERLEDPADRAFLLAFMSNAKALVEMHLGNLEESLRLVTEGIERFDRELPPESHQPHRTVLHHNRAQVLAALGRQEAALAEFGHVIDVDPNYPEYRFDRGNLLSRMGRQAEAMADYEDAMRLGPPFPELYYNRGDLRAATGDLEGAIADFRYVLDLEPDYLDARVSLASLLLDAGEPQDAAAQARAGLDITPDEARLHCTLGLAMLDLADHEAAWQSFTRALAIDPGLPEALADRAVAAYELGRYADAIADLTAALHTRPGDPDLLYNRGFALQAAGRPADAIADYSLALAADGADRAALLYQRGRCYAALGRALDASADFGAHLALGPSAHEQEIDRLVAAGPTG